MTFLAEARRQVEAEENKKRERDVIRRAALARAKVENLEAGKARRRKRQEDLVKHHDAVRKQLREKFGAVGKNLEPNKDYVALILDGRHAIVYDDANRYDGQGRPLGYGDATGAGFAVEYGPRCSAQGLLNRLAVPLLGVNLTAAELRKARRSIQPARRH